MAWQDVTFVWIDNEADRGRSGFGLDVTAAKDYSTTLLGALEAASDGKVKELKSTTTTVYTVDVGALTGTEHVERVGTLQLYNRGIRRTIKLQVLAIKDAAIQKPVVGQYARESILDATALAIFTAFITDSGEASEDWEIMRNYISERRS